MPVRVMVASRRAIEQTHGLCIDRMVIVDHHYPLWTKKDHEYLIGWANDWNAELISPPINLGAHGGYNFALHYLNIQSDEDIVFTIDPDSLPLTPRWMEACIDALRVDKTLGGVSLTHVDIEQRAWQLEEGVCGAPNLHFIEGPEMYNMTAFRFAVLRAKGLQADSKLYGFVETAMHRHFKKLGLRHGYLADYFEGQNPEPHDKSYQKWKRAMADGSYPHNFDKYVSAEPQP